MVRSGMLQYGINVFDDGRTVVQSMSCPSDHRARVGKIETSELGKLLEDIGESHFADTVEAYGVARDTEVIALAYVDHCSVKFVYGYNGVLGTEELSRLADLIDRVVGTGDLVP
jgi:hypothetical protein